MFFLIFQENYPKIYSKFAFTHQYGITIIGFLKIIIIEHCRTTRVA